MKQALIEALEKCGFKNGTTLFLQGTLAANDPYPDNFVTYWTDYTDDNTHLDNKTISVDWHFTVIYYSNDPEKVEKKPTDIIKTLHAAGFIPQGEGQDIASDEPTHTGWAMEFIGTKYL